MGRAEVKRRRKLAGAALAAGVLTAVLGGTTVPLQQANAESAAEKGKQVVFDRRKGNCMSCHVIEGASLPGNLGPPLLQMKARFPDKTKLRQQVWDATKNNPQSLMPPFGRHRILTEEEIDLVVEYLYTL